MSLNRSEREFEMRQSDVNQLGLRTFGYCSKCGRDFALFYNRTGGVFVIPSSHQCEGAGKPANGVRSEVENLPQALQLAKLLVEDDGACLDTRYPEHSVECEHGNVCDRVRRDHAAALGMFFLKASWA